MDANFSYESPFKNQLSHYECRFGHANDVAKKLIKVDLDYAIFDKARNIKVCETPQSNPCTVSINIDGKKYLYMRFSSGPFQLSDNYRIPDGYTGMIVEGVSPDETILDARNLKFNGIAFDIDTLNQNLENKFLYIRNLSIIGGYTGFENKANKTPRRDTANDREKWQKAIWVIGGNSHALISNLKISGFYYGVTAEENGDAVTEYTRVSDSGDGGFFSYYGGRLYVCNSESSFAADAPRIIGYGFVAESLHYRRTDDKGTPQCKGGNPNTPDPWDRVEFINCVSSASMHLPEINRAYIFIRNSSSHDNLYAGILANLGASINVEHSAVFNHHSDFAMQIERLNVHDMRRPNVYSPGEFGAGHGILSRFGSAIIANNNKVYNNLIGFNAYWNGIIDASGSDAWNNSYFAFHSVLKGFIDASSTRSFGISELFSYAVDNGSGIQVDHGLALDAETMSKYRGDTRFCEQFEDPCLHGNYLSAQAKLTTRRILKIEASAPKLGVFYYTNFVDSQFDNHSKSPD